MQIITGLLSLALVFTNSCHSRARRPQSETLTLEATVEKIGKDPGVGSGGHAVYQLAKYKVTSVCEGEYDQPEIVVDHLLLEGSELKDLRVGDKVRLYIRKSKTIFVRNNEAGFRQDTDEVDQFYIGEKPEAITTGCERCAPCP